MKTKKPSQLRIKRSKRKAVVAKGTVLKDQPWYTGAAKSIGIVRDGQPQRRGAVESP